ncbi:MAG: HEAT repeat domain-containing protein [Flavobacteriaceae bacterium]|nr:HEAT repeat domain-containing protein [Flavobacteriaceae bacterium]
MKCDKIQNSILDYIENNLSEKESAEFVNHMNTCENCKTELKEMQELLSIIPNDIIEHPSESLRNNFEKMLSEEKQQTKIVKLNSKSNWKSFLQIAASVALLISVFLFGRYQQTQQINQEVVELKNESLAIKQTVMLALMENKSASKRIQGVQYIEEFSDPDPAIMSALIKRMLGDENTNVRLTAANALQGFIASEIVKNAFIKALETEKDPSIQITIIQLLVKVQEKKAAKPMQKLLLQEETQPFVKEKIKSVLSNII